MADRKAVGASAPIGEINFTTSSGSPPSLAAQDIELAAASETLPELTAEEEASRSKLRITAIVTALYVRIFSRLPPII